MDYLRALVGRDGATAVDNGEFVLVTPRDRSSKYVVFLFLRPGSSEPVVVAKVARLREYADNLAREAALLDAVQDARPGGFDTIPRVLAVGEQAGHLILVQTALAGDAIDHATVRRRRDQSVSAVLEWLEALPAESNAAAVDPAWFARLVEAPLHRLANVLDAGGETRLLVERTRELLEPLRAVDIPLVLEHGDVGHPNLIRLRDGRVGVVDWELADLRGLPAHDLFFFLTYAAFAAGWAWTPKRRLSVFHDTFFRPGSWALPAVRDYARRLEIPLPLMSLLFLACWARQTSGLVDRVEGVVVDDADAEPPPRRLRRSVTAYIQQNAYHALWRHAVDHLEALAWSPVSDVGRAT